MALDDILDYISANQGYILAVCVSALTANYEAGLIVLRHAKAACDDIVTVMGNDHFTALPRQCMSRSGCIDYGFVGNEVVGSVTRLMTDLRSSETICPETYPGMITSVAGNLVATPMLSEPVFTLYNHELLDSAFTHEAKYRANFQKRIAPRVRELLGRDVMAGVTVEIGRGCIKFSNDDACSFCSIQYGGLWRNQLNPAEAWAAIEAAWTRGYDYLYLTADELPLTFNSLLTAMAETRPAWWSGTRQDERPLLVGYARADGIAEPRRTQRLVDLGIRQVMIGMDAGSATSLAALNKPLAGRRGDHLRRAERLYSDNSIAVRVAREAGLLIRAGFVVGHIGLTADLLRENVERICALVDEGRDIFSAVDVEVLSPQPGSADFGYLTQPIAATEAANRLGLEVEGAAELERVAAIWGDTDIVIPELAMRDYVKALMPTLAFEDLVEARSVIRRHARKRGVVIGE